ncbi:MAG: BCCT family transporter [Pseudomonadota bacterium]
MSELPTSEISDLEYETEYEIGQDNVEVMGLDVHNPVFFLAASLVVLFSALTLIFPDTAGSILSSAKAGTLNSFDWLFAVTPVLIFAFCLALCLSPLGRIRLGGPEAAPEFRMLSWIAMLFAAGVGVGFMFYGAGEPLSYFYGAYGYATPAYDVPLNAVPGSAEAERLAFSVTIFHWGLAPWAIYAVVGLALGYFAHSKGLPLSIRSAFYPLLGERIWGWPGHLIDLMAVVSTVFGLATTIGIGGTQAAAGIAYVTGIEAGLWLQIALILTMTALAVVSVLRGLDGGVKLLSNINMTIAFGLLLFVMIAGPSLMIVTGLGQNLIAYFADMPALTNWVGREDKVWFHDWTIFYWAWWISWSPFVGMFIARISKGRTVRQYFAVVLLAPFTICAIWFTAFGETAIFQATNDIGALAGGLGESGGSATALFKMLEALPFGMVTSVIAIVLLIVFIVTSADSGALVIDTITSGGKTDAPVIQRVFWACMIGITASALLYGGTSTSALYTLQAGTITAALPFTVILLACCVSLYLGMREEHRTIQAVQEAAPAE